ncbi:effector binding domain-containing protein [Lysinibacillus macroides]|uniref:Transcriptional regulator n=1 Tax=Lysinibacillus macroides TaxID=33935 RepID=A0A0N0UWW3_9BACI|nr:effector binding domain-containing protein [Lysinibacillus macroides]KOY82277.1 transcriptional regulator [Lysinibacillus macroides]QPR68137.1 effector binding domain-containing protein [Lysinibacillus macroides]
MQSYCQSCGMPLVDGALLGTEKEGQKSQEYCTYCYELGEYRQRNLTVEEMIEYCIPHLQKDGMSEDRARNMLTAFLPSLKRWRKNELKEPNIVERDAFYMIGISAETSNAKEITSKAKIPQLWADFYRKNIMGQITNPDNQTIYALYSDYQTDVNGDYTITLGIGVTNRSEVPTGMVLKVIPAAKYMVFTSKRGAIPEIVIQAWQDIWAWFAGSDVERTYTGDFELYDERSTNPQEAQVAIYIAIK